MKYMHFHIEKIALNHSETDDDISYERIPTSNALYESKYYF